MRPHPRPRINVWRDGADARNALTVARSADDGKSWSTPVAVDLQPQTSFTHGDDKEALTADPTRPGYVYLVWDRYSNQAPNFKQGSSQNSSKGPAYFSRSTDGGRTWSNKVALYAAENGTIGNQVLVLPNGTLVDLFVNYVVTAASKGAGVTVNLMEVRSTDAGATWTAKPVTVAAMDFVGASDPIDGAYIRGGDGLFSAAVNPANGNLYATWQDNRFGRVDQVVLTRSTDGGSTWSAPALVSDTPPSSNPLYTQAFTPTVAVAANGTVAVTYYDFRNNATSGPVTDKVDYWAQTSTDGGQTWGASTRLTASSFPASVAPQAGGLMIGDYEALTSVGGTFAAVFQVDNANPSNPTDIQLATFPG